MRDNHEGYPEIVNAYERGGQYFGAVKLERAGETATVEFGVSESGYTALRCILSARPFDKMPGIPHRYFFCGSFTGAQPGTQPYTFGVRVEQGTTAKKLNFDGPKALLANLIWFRELKSLDETAGLNRL